MSNDKLTQALRDMEMAAYLMAEAAALIGEVPPEVLESLPSFRWPLADELGGGASILRAHIAAHGAEKQAPGFDECAASGQSCSYGPHGPDGAMQCRYCGKAKAEKQAGPAANDWRRLALQFDGQRMAAMAHLQMLLQSPDHADAVRAFLDQTPSEQIASVRTADKSAGPVAFVHWPLNGPPRLVWYSNEALQSAMTARGTNGHIPDLLLYAAPPESDKVDAERYRHIRAHSYVEVHCDSPRADGWTPEKLDAAVDAARAKKDQQP